MPRRRAKTPDPRFGSEMPAGRGRGGPSGSPILARELREAQDRFIAAWGQMGSTWGISRTMAETHALLYITARPMNTDQVMDRLRISRGNASTSLRALVDWGIVARSHRPGDRKEYFHAEGDAWAILRRVIRERLRREVHPVLASLFEIRELTDPAHARREPAGSAGQVDRPPQQESAQRAAPARQDEKAAAPSDPDHVAEHNRRLDALLDLLQMMDRLGERFVGSDGKGLRLAASILSKVS
ncbi:MAG TPA: MarR family transcriptional regulator [Phycisphaerales bacterium]|nr:MarR family transcriptional regulator [Phycisphaerales bacterium]